MKTGYYDRLEAGKALAEPLKNYYDADVLLLAVPRGGVPVALPVAEALQCDLDLTIPRKIGAPHQPETAIGAVCEDGEVLLNMPLVRTLNVTEDYIKRAAAREVAEIRRRLTAYRGLRPKAQPEGRTVIVIDDGAATGFTVTAALRAVARLNPKELILAIPVAPRDTVGRLAEEVDHIVCPLQPEEFYAVGQFYAHFGPVSDTAVCKMLQSVWDKKRK